MKENRFHTSSTQGRYRYFKRPSPKDAPRDSLFHEPGEGQVAGDIRVGRIRGTSMIFGIRKKEFVQHCLLVGRSGAGKTNVIRLVLAELNRLGVPFLTFDLAKYGTRYLKHDMKDLIILRWDKEFFFNPLLSPPSVNLKEWLLVFTEISTDMFGLRTASKMFLTEFIQTRLFQNYDSRKVETCPTLHDLDRELENRLAEKPPLNERGYINGIKSKVKTICVTLDEMVNVHEGIPIEALLDYPVCIELVGIKSAEIQVWIISLLLAWITAYREARQMSFGGLKHVLIFDEAAKLVGKGER